MTGANIHQSDLPPSLTSTGVEACLLRPVGHQAGGGGWPVPIDCKMASCGAAEPPASSSFLTVAHIPPQDNWALKQVKAEDLVLLQNYPLPVVAPPGKPAPPWAAVPYAPHCRGPRSAPVPHVRFLQFHKMPGHAWLLQQGLAATRHLRPSLRSSAPRALVVPLRFHLQYRWKDPN